MESAVATTPASRVLFSEKLVQVRLMLYTIRIFKGSDLDKLVIKGTVCRSYIRGPQNRLQLWNLANNDNSFSFYPSLGRYG